MTGRAVTVYRPDAKLVIDVEAVTLREYPLGPLTTMSAAPELSRPVTVITIVPVTTGLGDGGGGGFWVPGEVGSSAEQAAINASNDPKTSRVNRFLVTVNVEAIGEGEVTENDDQPPSGSHTPPTT